MTILVVEDEPRLRATLVSGLSEEGFAATGAATAAAAIAAAGRGGLRAVVLDLGLPDDDGQRVIAAIRASSDVPIVVASARDALAERLRALDAGADDYLIKPFEFAELLARLRATLRRAPPAPRRRWTAGNVELVVGEPVVRIGAAEVVFSPRERALLEALIARLGAVCTRRELLRDAFGYDFDPGTNIVEVHVGHVRKKLSGATLTIETVRGYGYRARVP